MESKVQQTLTGVRKLERRNSLRNLSMPQMMITPEVAANARTSQEGQPEYAVHFGLHLLGQVEAGH